MVQYLITYQLECQMNIKLNNLGLYLILILMMLVLVHKEVSRLFVYYREIFGLLFIVLLFLHKPSHLFHSLTNRKVYLEIIFLILFPLTIIISALFDPMVELYGDSLSVGVTAYDGNVNPKIYVFRNAVIYLPMVLYIAIRGLSESDINKIAVVSALFAPISIIIFMARLSDYSVVTQFELLISNKIQIEYNTFVPCFTISILSIVYLIEIQYKKFNLLIKILLMSILVFVFSFIFYSTSRQALLLALIYLVIFITKNFSLLRLKNFLYYAILAVALIFLYDWITFNYGEHERITARLTHKLMNSPRLQIALNGLAMLNKTEFFTGAGLTSVIVSGPHNDYIRWIQRVGLIFAFISFYPYFSVMLKSFIDALYSKANSVHLFIFCLSLFVIYNSMFGYPREDAYQSLWCFLGISIWLGFSNYNKRKNLKMYENN